MSKMTKTIAALGVVAGLGVAALPLSSYADTADFDVNATVLESISITTEVAGEEATSLNLGNVTPGSALKSGAMTVTVHTNSDAGYTLTAKTKDDDNSMVNTDSSLTEKNKIAAATTVGQSNTAWGVRIGDATNYRIVPGASATDALTIKTSAPGTALTNNQESTNLTFGVSVAEGAVAAGDYKATVVFTAVSQ